MYGGAGDDVIYVTEIGDVVYGGAGIDTVYTTVGQDLANFHDVENIVLLGVDNGTLVGDEGPNSLTGNEGHNDIQGLGGNDTLIGNGGDRSEEHTSELQSL